MDSISYPIIFAARLSNDALMLIGGLGGAVIVMLAFANWRAALKATLVVLLFEGAIRKWILPTGQELVYFLKDGILLGAYLRFFIFPDPELRRYQISAPVFAFWILALCVCFSAFNPNINSLLISLYGIKIYFYLYLLDCINCSHICSYFLFDYPLHSDK